METFFAVCPWSRCISIDASKDRRIDTRVEFARRGIANPIFFVTKRDNQNPGRGCYMSHLKCMKRALDAGQSHALVFEDDVSFRNVPQRVWDDAARFIASHPFDVLLLGWCTGDGYRPNMCRRTKQVPGYKHIYETKCLCTHAVVYSKTFMEFFVQEYSNYPGYEIDDVFTDIPGLEMFMVSPALFDQRDVESTIDDPHIERVFQL